MPIFISLPLYLICSMRKVNHMFLDSTKLGFETKTPPFEKISEIS
jgi:hypothetical protein